jgi:hypothetical protein
MRGGRKLSVSTAIMTQRKFVFIGERTLMKYVSLLALLFLIMCGTSIAQSQTQAQADSVRQDYTSAEYDAFQAAQMERDPVKVVKLLDDFVSHYPKSILLRYVYPLYLQEYLQLKDYSKVIEYADELAGLGDKVDFKGRLLALQDAAIAYNNLNSSDPQLATRARERALMALELVSDFKNPGPANEQVFEANKRRAAIYFQATAGAAAIAMRNYPAAVESFNAIIALDSVPTPIGAQCNF